MTRNSKLFLTDILDCMVKIDKFIKGMQYEEFVADDKTSSAVIRKLEIIGEAVKNIPMEVRNKYLEIPWKEMAGMRDKLIHWYFGVDYELVWKVIKEDLPNLKPKFEKILITLE
jgi:uncharacterized protein with HEPN domain